MELIVFWVGNFPRLLYKGFNSVKKKITYLNIFFH